MPVDWAPKQMSKNATSPYAVEEEFDDESELYSGESDDDPRGIAYESRQSFDMEEERRRRDELADTPVDSLKFNVFICVIVIVNIAVVGAEVDSLCTRDDEACVDTTGLWRPLKMIFLFIFIIELLLRMYFHRGLRFTRDWINWFDIILIGISLIDLFSDGGAAIIGALRAIRIVRVVRLVRLFRLFKELYLITEGMKDVIVTLGWGGGFAALFVYIMGVFLTMGIGHNCESRYDYLFDAEFSESPWTCDEYFGTVDKSMFTLFQVMTLDDWSTHIVRPLMEENTAYGFFFIFFIMFATYGLLNVIIGVICENCLQLAKSNDEKVQSMIKQDTNQLLLTLKDAFVNAQAPKIETMERSRMSIHPNGGPRKTEQRQFTQADADEATIDKETFLAQINIRSVQEKLAMCDIPTSDAEQLFEMIDADGSGDITWDEFLTGCQKVKGPARGEDLFKLTAGVEDQMRKTNGLVKKLKRQDETLSRIVDQVDVIYGTHFDPRNKPTSGPVLNLLRSTATKNAGTGKDFFRSSIANSPMNPLLSRRHETKDEGKKRKKAVRTKAAQERRDSDYQ